MAADRLDRNQRARAMFHAECLDRRTRTPGQHGGVLKRSGLAVLKALLFQFANAATGRCDPGYDAIARAAGVARSTVAVALRRLEAAGLLERIRRQAGPVRYSNAYVFAWSGFRSETTTNKKPNPQSARTVPAVATEPPPMTAVFARIRAELRADHEAIVRARQARLARQAGAGQGRGLRPAGSLASG